MVRVVFVYWVLKYVFFDGFCYIKVRGLCGIVNEIRNKIKFLVVCIMFVFFFNRVKFNFELVKIWVEFKEKFVLS